MTPRPVPPLRPAHPPRPVRSGWESRARWVKMAPSRSTASVVDEGNNRRLSSSAAGIMSGSSRNETSPGLLPARRRDMAISALIWRTRTGSIRTNNDVLARGSLRLMINHFGRKFVDQWNKRPGRLPAWARCQGVLGGGHARTHHELVAIEHDGRPQRRHVWPGKCFSRQVHHVAQVMAGHLLKLQERQGRCKSDARHRLEAARARSG